MAATRRKFTVPAVEDLQDEREIKRLKSLFSFNKKSSEDIQEATGDSYTVDGSSDPETNTGETTVRTTKCGTQQSKDLTGRTVMEYKAQNFLISGSQSSEPEKIQGITRDNDSNTMKSTIGKTFRETFAFLEDTSHYKETVAKIKEKELAVNAKVLSGQGTTKPKSSAIVVNPRQKGNPLLKHVRNVPWEIGDIIPDYVLGTTTCALFLSLRYHHFNPEYIHERLRQLGQRFDLRILLVQVDVKDPHQTLRELAKMAIMAECTLILAWSPDEAARYLETFKVYENKPPDALLGQNEGDHFSKLTDCLTTIKGINKTDVVSLSSTFGSLAKIATASKDDLALLPGFGPLKAQRLHDLLQQPFVAERVTGQEKTNEQ